MFKFIVAFAAAAVPALSLAQPASPARPAITRISHVTLFADDLQKSRQFYGDLLGWTRCLRALPAPECAFMPIIRSMSRCYRRHPRDWRIVWTQLPSPLRTRRQCASLGSQGVAVPDHVTVEADGSRSFVVRDPEGGKVGFTQDGQHPPVKPASAAQSLSSHIIHAGYVVHDRAVMDHFYKDLLGFHLYWQGGNPPAQVNWVMMQVPSGTDWMNTCCPCGQTRRAVNSGPRTIFLPAWSAWSSCSKGWRRAAGRPLPARIRRRWAWMVSGKLA